jgi:hypothetical protein
LGRQSPSDPGELVTRFDSDSPAVPLNDRSDAGVIQNCATAIASVHRHGECKSRIIRPCVVVRRSSAKSIATERWLLFLDLGAVETVMTSDVAEEGEGVIEGEAGGKPPSGHPGIAVYRPGESQRANQVGREAKQSPPFGAGLENEAQMPVLEITQSAVNEAG